MVAMTNRTWHRWQDWTAVVIGVLTALSPIVVATDTAALWTLIVFGVLIAAAGLWSLSAPGSVASEYVHVVLGVLLFVSPWVFAYADLTGAAWTSWVAGVLTVAVGFAAVPAAQADHRSPAGQH
ncbi:SPW repeat protein [Pseudonocardia humida]|uniref:SPW repeat protein n=1 Tax=Pseudonocardia humida TaxID=2800819 RepID=A0ABT1A124_9PSEU|nr:SPW repeat protein [Pseudonocardia humida]MCO1656594.1 SPW repeat protein [Pseudonocardia humida]